MSIANGPIFRAYHKARIRTEPPALAGQRTPTGSIAKRLTMPETLIPEKFWNSMDGGGKLMSFYISE